MPVTFFAHQLPVLPLKVRRPGWFDGTALCVGSMTPDLAYPLPWIGELSHGLVGVVLWCVPVAVVICFAIRRWVAGSVFAQLPDAGPYRFRSYRVLAHRRPVAWQTLTSALLGAATHVVLDAFTHPGRWGARLLDLGDIVLVIPMVGERTGASTLQLFGHAFGSAACILVLRSIGSERMLERWYGAEEVERARDVSVAVVSRVVFWAIVAASVPTALAWHRAQGGALAFLLIDSLAALTAAAALVTARTIRTGHNRTSQDA